MYIMYKLRFCTSCNLYKQFVQVATRTTLAVQVVICTEFQHQIISTCTILLYKLDFKRVLVKLTNFFENISYFRCINMLSINKILV